MISCIIWGVCFLVNAAYNASLAVRIICGILSFISFVLAMVCHRQLVEQVELLEKCLNQFINMQNEVNKESVKAMRRIAGIHGDDLK